MNLPRLVYSAASVLRVLLVPNEWAFKLVVTVLPFLGVPALVEGN